MTKPKSDPFPDVSATAQVCPTVIGGIIYLKLRQALKFWPARARPHVQTLRRAIRAGRLSASTYGGEYFLTPLALATYDPRLRPVLTAWVARRE